LSIRQDVRSWQCGLLVCCSLVSMVSCGSKSAPEKWIIPENYEGWLRLNYAVKGAPLLPIEEGFSVVRMPQSGHMETSTLYNSSIDRNEFFVGTPQGLQRLDFSQNRVGNTRPSVEKYAVQKAYGFFSLVSGAIQKPGKCVFVGTDPAFRDNGRNCQGWEPGQSEPPKFKRHIVLRVPTDSSED